MVQDVVSTLFIACSSIYNIPTNRQEYDRLGLRLTARLQVVEAMNGTD